MFVHPVKDRPIGKQRNPTGADASENGLPTADIEEGLALTGKDRREAGPRRWRWSARHTTASCPVTATPRRRPVPRPAVAARQSGARGPARRGHAPCRSAGALFPPCRPKRIHFRARIDELSKGVGRQAEAGRHGKPRHPHPGEIGRLTTHAWRVSGFTRPSAMAKGCGALTTTAGLLTNHDDVASRLMTTLLREPLLITSSEQNPCQANTQPHDDDSRRPHQAHRHQDVGPLRGEQQIEGSFAGAET